jgi:hypothetical protein
MEFGAPFDEVGDFSFDRMNAFRQKTPYVAWTVLLFRKRRLWRSQSLSDQDFGIFDMSMWKGSQR